MVYETVTDLGWFVPLIMILIFLINNLQSMNKSVPPPTRSNVMAMAIIRVVPRYCQIEGRKISCES